MTTVWLIAGALLAPACGRGTNLSSSTAVIRLVDHFDAKQVVGPSGADTSPPRTEWRFDGTVQPTAAKTAAATKGWEAGTGISGLAVKDGLLVGRTTDAVSILHLERTAGLESPDELQSIEVRLRVSDGANVSVQTIAGPAVNFTQIVEGLRRNPWQMSSPVQAGSPVQTYTFTPVQAIPASRVRHLLIRPTDVQGADFAVESVRVILRAEHLATMAAGIGWQGLGDIYRETLVARAPETLRFDLQLPKQPWLDLAVGTLGEGPLTFRVVAKPSGGAAAGTVQLDHTVTTPYRWEANAVDLSKLGGQRVTLELALVSETPGALGFWGAPVVRARGVSAPIVPQANGGNPGLGNPPQGVILIQTDTLRKDHLEAYGYSRKTAPVIARMGAEGVLFKNAIAQAVWTKASTPSVMTSLYPATLGVRHINDRVPSSATTIAEVYRAAGYATFSLSSVPFTGQPSNLHQGFEELHENGSLGPPNTPFRIKTARPYVDRTVAWLEQHKDAPFFVYLHVMDPHSPYEPYPPYNTLFGPPGRKDEHQRQVREVTKLIANPALKSRGMPTREEVVKAGFDPEAFIAQEVDWYDGSIRAMDVEIGRLLERLAGLGLDDKTLIVVFGDHGDEFHEHGNMFHEHSVYGELTDVPLLVRWPGRVPNGRNIGETVQLIDVMPTLLDLSRLAHPKGLQGQSLMPFLRPGSSGEKPGTGWKPRPAIAQSESITDNPEPDRAFASRAIVDGQWKLIHKTVRPPGTREFELYDYDKDPLNKQDLAAANPAVVGRLAKALEGWEQMATAARVKPDAEATKGLSAQELQRLRSLGYVR